MPRSTTNTHRQQPTNTPSQSPEGTPRNSLPASDEEETRALNVRNRALEVQKNVAEDENRALRRKLADMENRQTDPSDARRKRARTDGDGQDSDEEDSTGDEENNKRSDDDKVRSIKEKAREFVTMHALWFHGGLKGFQRDPGEEIYLAVEDRFKSTESRGRGQLRDLLEFLPTQYHSEIKSGGYVSKLFWEEMNQQRSNLSTRVRPACGSDIFDCSKQDLASSTSRRDRFREKIGWGQDNGKEAYVSAINLGLIHGEPFHGKFNKLSAFRNPIVKRVFVATTFGPSGLTSYINTGKASRKGMPNAVKWRLTHTTPGAIAGSAVLARWALSADDDLKDQGNETGLEYFETYEEYLHILMAGLEANKKHVMELFREWDAEFFPATQDTGLGATKKTTNEGNTSFADALKEIDDDTEESDEETEEANRGAEAEETNEHQDRNEQNGGDAVVEGANEQQAEGGSKQGEGEAARE